MTYKTFFHSALILIFVGIWDSGAQEDQVYTRSKSYKSLRMTYEDLSDLVLTIQEFLSNSTEDSSYVRDDWLSVENKSQKLTISGNFQLEEFNKAPTKATQVWYRFSAWDHPIERVNISLRDYRREVEIAGSSFAQVQALSAMIDEHLEAKEIILGVGFRISSQIALIIIFMSLASFYLLIKREKIVIPYLSTVVLILLAINICVFFVFPLEDWLPGTAIYMDTASLLEKFSPEFTFFGAICGFISLCCLLWRAVRNRQNEGMTQSDG